MNMKHYNQLIGQLRDKHTHADALKELDSGIAQLQALKKKYAKAPKG